MAWIFLPAMSEAGTTADKRGGINGSMQHLLKILLNEAKRLISFGGDNSNETKALL